MPTIDLTIAKHMRNLAMQRQLVMMANMHLNFCIYENL